jgi:hypothetical protein
MRFAGIVAFFCTCCAVSSPGQAVSPAGRLERVIAVVPLVGAGTFEDPKRPLLAELAQRREEADDAVGFNWEPSDDGRMAIVEFTASHRSTLLPLICADVRTASRMREGQCAPGALRGGVKVFTPGLDRKEEIEQGLKRYKRDFDAGKLAERGR